MFNMTLPDPPLPLAQPMEFEVGETFSVNTSVDEDDNYYELGHALIEVMILMRLLWGGHM